MEFTLRNIADMIAARDFLDEDDRDVVQRALRWFRDSQVLVAKGGSGGRGREAQFDELNTAKALVLSVLPALDVNGEGARIAVKAMTADADMERPVGKTFKSRGMDAALVGVRKGERWYLVFRLYSDIAKGRRLTAKFVQEGHETISSIVDGSAVRKDLARIDIDLNAALAPLIGK